VDCEITFKAMICNYLLLLDERSWSKLLCNSKRREIKQEYYWRDEPHTNCSTNNNLMTVQTALGWQIHGLDCAWPSLSYDIPLKKVIGYCSGNSDMKQLWLTIWFLMPVIPWWELWLWF